MRIHDELLALKHTLSIETDQRKLVEIEVHIARLNVAAGDDEQALLFADLAGQRSRLSNDRPGEATAAALAAQARAHRGDVDLAAQLLEQARQAAGDAPPQAVLLDLAEAAVALDRSDVVAAIVPRLQPSPSGTHRAAVDQALHSKRPRWQALALVGLARAEGLALHLVEAEGAYTDAIGLSEAESEDTLVAEISVELALFLVSHSRKGQQHPPAYWLGQALNRLQASGQFRLAHRVRTLLKTHGRRMTDKLLDIGPLHELGRIQEVLGRAQTETRAVDELIQRLFHELDRLGVPEMGEMSSFLRDGVAEHVGQAGQCLIDVAKRNDAFSSTVQELCIEQERFVAALQAIESLFSVADDARLADEIARTVAEITGASGVALLTHGALVVHGAMSLADARAEGLSSYLSGDVPQPVALDERNRGLTGRAVEEGSVLIERLIRDGRAIGVLYCKRSHGRFGQGALRQLERFVPLIATLLDSRRIAAERQLDASTRRATLEAISDAVFMLTADDTLLVMNARAAAVLGLPEGTQSATLDKYPALREVRGELRGGDEARPVDGRLVQIEDTQYLLNARAVPDASAWVVTMTEMRRAASMAQSIVGPKARYTFRDIIHRSESMQKLIALAEQLAPLPTSVLLSGESGTGKEMFAQAIHNGSRARQGPFVAVNCAAIPRDLLESELFGYEAGAFTGALRRGRPGKFELADGGTLFLDEIGEMPMEMQSKLLRVLQDKAVERLGAGRPLDIDVRIIAATNRRLEEGVARGMFRQDLYFRLRGVHLLIPALRERLDDIVALVEHLMQVLPRRFAKQLQRVAPKVLDQLVRYRWPGNVRELEQAIELEVSLAPPHATVIDWLPSLLQSASGDSAPPQPMSHTSYAGGADPGAPLPGTRDASNLSLEQQERALLIEALRRYHGSVPDVARAVGLSRATVYNKLSKYNIAAKSFRDVTQ